MFECTLCILCIVQPCWFIFNILYSFVYFKMTHIHTDIFSRMRKENKTVATFERQLVKGETRGQSGPKPLTRVLFKAYIKVSVES